MTNLIGARKGRNWIKIIGVITLVGVLIALVRIVLRVFREKPVTGDESIDDEVHGV